MTTTETPKSPRNVTRWIWQIAFLVIMLVVVRILWMRTQPEILADTLGIGNSDIISGDYLYRLNNNLWVLDHRETAIYAIPLHPGVTHKISQEDAHWQVYSNQMFRNDGHNPFSIAEGELFYGIEPVSELGYNIHAQETLFRRVPLRGGQSRDAATLHGRNFCLVGSHVFWLRPKPETIVKATPGLNAQSRKPCDLMLTSLLDNTTLCIRAGVPFETVIAAGASGVHWTEIAPLPNPPTLFYARVADGSVHAQGNVAPGQLVRSMVEMGDRCYWAIDLPPNPAAPSVGWELMSAKLDGTDRRVVFSQVQNHPVVSILPYVYRGNLYCLYTSQESASAFPQSICRVHPDRANPIEILRKLPKGMSGFQFDGGYLYGTKAETHRGAWETLTNDTVNDASSTTLCRFPLE